VFCIVELYHLDTEREEDKETDGKMALQKSVKKQHIYITYRSTGNTPPKYSTTINSQSEMIKRKKEEERILFAKPGIKYYVNICFQRLM
jgi:hypothetical protein